MNFENKNLIVLTKTNNFQLDTLEELVEIYFGKDFKEKTEEEKIQKRYEKIYPLAVLHKAEILLNNSNVVIDGKIKNIESANKEKTVYIDSDRNFFLSLCKMGEIKIFEKKDANIFGKNINKSQMNGNYIIIDMFLDKILP